jgi:ribose/xylose/arabinose/galactoside ABC-type transport system permease subunit
MTSPTSPPAAESAAPGLLRLAMRKFGAVLALLAVFTLFAALRPQTFATWDNIQIMALQTAVIGTAALGMTLIIIAAGIDLSVGSQIALTTVAVAWAMARLAGDDVATGVAEAPAWLPWVGVGVGLLVGMAAGFAIGTLITGMRLAPFIVTLGAWGAIRGAAKGLAHEQMVLAPDTWINGLLQTLPAERQWMLLPPGVWLMFALALLVGAMLRYTVLGRHLLAIGSNEQTARLCGVPVARTKITVYTLGGLFAGIAGVLQFSYLTVGDPTTASGYELDIIAAVVIGGASLSGGKGSVFGTLVGAFIMTVVRNGCTKMEYPNWVQEIVTGGIIVAAVSLDRLRQGRGR